MKKSTYSITVQLGDKILKGEGDTVAEALIAIPRPEKIMEKGIVTIRQGNLKKELLMFPIRLKRLFYNKNFQVIQAKWLGAGLK